MLPHSKLKGKNRSAFDCGYWLDELQTFFMKIGTAVVSVKFNTRDQHAIAQCIS